MSYSTVLFILLLSVFLYWKRKNLRIQKILFPVLYIVLYPTKIGLGLMQRIGTRYREIVKVLGYMFIGIAFLGMLYAIINLFLSFYIIFREPQPVVQLILPGSNIPGVGRISFSYWIISIFVLAFVHEFAHGAVAIAHKLKLKSSGFGFFSVIIPLIPLFFVEPDEKELRKKDDAAQYSVFAAGPVINISVYFALALVISLVMNPVLGAISEPKGITLEAINESYSSHDYFAERTFINSVGNKTVLSISDFVSALSDVKPNDLVVLANDENEFILTAAASPDNSTRGFLGVTGFRNEFEFFNPLLGNSYLWFYNLLLFVAVLNLLVGLINLLPIGPIDGGRMIYLFLSSTMKSKEKAKKWWAYISWTTILILILLFVLPPIIKWI
jgi:membrane-associated protease RseP (regulator of RpoE activity)